MKKQFKAAAAAAKPVYSTIIASAQDTQDAQVTQDTQPSKKPPLPRINMAFSKENLDYLRVMAALNGQSVTRYVNSLVEEDRTRKAEIYQTARTLTAKGGE